jgi:hypothetical protein
MENTQEPSLEEHQQWAIHLFNHTWELLNLDERSTDQIDEMIHCAHASRFHWGVVGSPVNFTRGEWQISRVYSVLGRPEPALFHAHRALDICDKHKIGDFDRAFAYEALARAYKIAGNQEESGKYLELGRNCGERIRDKETKEVFFADLDSIK